MTTPGSDQADAFAELTDTLLAAGQVDQLVTELADPDLASEWDDAAMVAAVAEAYGRHAAGGRLAELAVLRRPDVSLALPIGSEFAGQRVGDRVEVDGVVRGPVAEHVAVVVDRTTWLLPAASVDVRRVTGLDADAQLHLVSGRRTDAAALDLDADVVVCRAARFVAHELVGVATAALDLAIGHVRDRHQFGVPIGSFQAVRHRLAEAHVQTVAARELLAAYPADADVALHLLVLKNQAGVAALAAVAAAQQVCGGMGFTEEFGLHRLVRRAHLLDALLGGTDDADARLGALAGEGRVLPDRTVVLS